MKTPANKNHRSRTSTAAAQAGKVTIRKLPSGVPGLDEILGGGLPEYSFNIIAGNPGCGKTTFARAILKEIAEICPRDRLLILEDTPELRSESPNTHLMRKPERWDLTPLVTITLRKNAKRICVSEVRDREALPLLDAWTTHRGGLATTHADSVEKCLDRLDRLAMRNGVERGEIGLAQQRLLVEGRGRAEVGDRACPGRQRQLGCCGGRHGGPG